MHAAAQNSKIKNKSKAILFLLTSKGRSSHSQPVSGPCAARSCPGWFSVWTTPPSFLWSSVSWQRGRTVCPNSSRTSSPACPNNNNNTRLMVSIEFNKNLTRTPFRLTTSNLSDSGLRLDSSSVPKVMVVRSSGASPIDTSSAKLAELTKDRMSACSCESKSGLALILYCRNTWGNFCQ